MEHTDSFALNLLLVAKDEKSAREINHYFMKAGLPTMDVETGINNVIPTLNKNNPYDGIIIDTGATSDAVMYIRKLRANKSSEQLPIVVLDFNPETTWLTVTQMYDQGANYYINLINEDVANHICWILQSLLNFIAPLKKGQERLYPR